MNTQAERQSLPTDAGETPLVSVVVPCLNEQAFIDKCLDFPFQARVCDEGDARVIRR